LFFGARQFSEGIGITKFAMYITLAANVINISLNWVLIYGKLGFPEMGVNGASTATLISRIFTMAAFAAIIIKKEVYNRYFKYFTRKLTDIDKIKDILRTSIPLSIQTLVEITAFSISAIMVGWLGKVPLASHQIAMSMSSFSFMLALGVGAAATIRVSHQY
jgi:MATE family multidrug resistance protein